MSLAALIRFLESEMLLRAVLFGLLASAVILVLKNAKIRTNEACATGDQNAHNTSGLIWVN